ncbi:MAG TPA: AEC family transporter [Thiobacillaceae bacterium]|nr:AEC family transporter [Thiobacillaceae bacterium]
MTPAFLIQLLLQVWLPIALLVAAGGLWTRYRADAFPPGKLRVYLNRLVVDVFAPPLLFALSAQAHIDRQMLTVPPITIAGILVSLALLYPLLYRSRLGAALSRETRAAILLAGCFGNVLFMGYPTLTFLYGDIGGSYAAFADVLASTPLVWTLGVWIATRLGHEGGHGHSLLRTVFTLPPVWAFVLGFAVNFAGLEVDPLVKAAKFMGQATIPIMLFTLGLSIPWGDLRPTPPVLAAVAVKLAIAPLIVWGLSRATLGGLHDAQTAAILEVAMPTMLMAASFADRFNLDVRAAALTASWTSLSFLVTLPVWIALLR